MGLGVTKAAVEFKHLGFPILDYESAVKNTLVWPSLCGHCLNGGNHYILHDFFKQFPVNHWSWRVGAHATGIWTLVVVVNGLVILGGSKWKHVFTIGYGHERGLLPFQKLFHNEPVSCLSKGLFHKDLIYCIKGLIHGETEDNALSCRKAVCLYNHWDAGFIPYKLLGSIRIGKDLVLSSWNGILGKEVLGKDLACLYFRGLFLWAKADHPVFLEKVHNSLG